MINVVGWYGKRNVGDDAFVNAFAEALRLSGLQEKIVHLEQAPKSGEPALLGGGDVIRPFYVDSFSREQILIPFGVGLGYESEADLLKHKAVPFCVVRNKADCELLKTANVDARFCPDLTFVLPDPVPALDSRDGSEKKRLCILLSDEVSPTFEDRAASKYMYYEYFKWELAKILDSLQEYYWVHMAAFSTLPSIDDRRINQDIYRRMETRNKVRLNEPFSSVIEARNFIAGFDLVITMKYHGMLFAVQSGVPFINLAETRKTQLFCQENGFQTLSVPPYSLEFGRVMSLVKTAENPSVRERLTRKGAELKATAKRELPDLLRKAAGAITAGRR